MKAGGGSARRMWGGGHREAPSALAAAYGSSLSVDWRLWSFDLAASRAWTEALARAGAHSELTARVLLDGLEAVAAGPPPQPDEPDEDVHSWVERRLHEEKDEVAGHLHLGRSRNDQVATDLNLWCRAAAAELASSLCSLALAIRAQAAREATTPMAGTTHLQPAQPVTLGHHLMAWVSMLERDLERLRFAANSAATLPLGAGALAGTAFPVDRVWLTRRLGFRRPSPNSLDAVGDRDAAFDLAYACAVCSVHLSRVAEDLVLWSTPQFGYVRWRDRHTTGSSLMPQKHNPDLAELARGQAAAQIGGLVTLLSVLKGLPTGYQRDLQGDKAALFAVADRLGMTLLVLAEALRDVRFDRGRLAASIGGATLATEVADHLAASGVPFREAHEIVARLAAEAPAGDLGALPLKSWQAVHPLLAGGAPEAMSVEAALSRRAVAGGTAPERVVAAANAALPRLRAGRFWARSERRRVPQLPPGLPALSLPGAAAV